MSDCATKTRQVELKLRKRFREALWLVVASVVWWWFAV